MVCGLALVVFIVFRRYFPTCTSSSTPLLPLCPTSTAMRTLSTLLTLCHGSMGALTVGLPEDSVWVINGERGGVEEGVDVGREVGV